MEKAHNYLIIWNYQKKIKWTIHNMMPHIGMDNANIAKLNIPGTADRFLYNNWKRPQLYNNGKKNYEGAAHRQIQKYIIIIRKFLNGWYIIWCHRLAWTAQKLQNWRSRAQLIKPAGYNNQGRWMLRWVLAWEKTLFLPYNRLHSDYGVLQWWMTRNCSH